MRRRAGHPPQVLQHDVLRPLSQRIQMTTENTPAPYHLVADQPTALHSLEQIQRMSSIEFGDYIAHLARVWAWAHPITPVERQP